jgi:LDH2 family malate/lactate/ureidoglycolate dehydrogenase
MNVSADCIRQQISVLLTAWGLDPEGVRVTAEVMVETDLAGIDSHGISMLMQYDDLRRRGQLRVGAAPRLVRENAVTALIDADTGLGHPAAVQGMRLAITKAQAAGIGAVAVINSAHFGAAGYYAALAAQQGLIGLAMSTTRMVGVLPTRASAPVLGTNPIAFAAPAGRHRPFLLDMSTSTAAINKVKVYDLKGLPLPSGWALDESGRPIVDSAVAMNYLFHRGVGGMTALGATEEMGSHKGYGLAMMVQILAGTLGGASFSPLRNRTQKPGEPDNIGHFFLALDPDSFRAPGEFESDLDAAIDVLHATPACDPALPVLVAGDPEASARERRQREGVPIPPALAEKIRALCARCGVPYLLEGGGGSGAGA